MNDAPWLVWRRRRRWNLIESLQRSSQTLDSRFFCSAWYSASTDSDICSEFLVFQFFSTLSFEIYYLLNKIKMTDCPEDKNQNDQVLDNDLHKVILHFVAKLKDDLKDLDGLLSGLDPYIIDKYEKEQATRRNRCVKLLEVLHDVVESNNKRELELVSTSSDERVERKKVILEERSRDADKIMTLMQEYNLIGASELAEYLSGTLDEATILDWSKDVTTPAKKVKSADFSRETKDARGRGGLYQPSKSNAFRKTKQIYQNTGFAQTPNTVTSKHL